LNKQSRNGVLAIALLLIAVLAGCNVTKKDAMTTSNDSLVAANPQEMGQGSVSPNNNYQAAPRSSSPARTTPRRSSPSRTEGGTSSLVASGTPIEVRVNSTISSKTASVGQSWSGTVESDVYSGNRIVIPAGSTVNGTVVAAKDAERGDRAMLKLGMSSVVANGRSYRVRGSSESIVAGSTRARNLGAIAAGTAAGAIIGKAAGGSGKSTIIGGLIGGAATTGAVAASKGYQVVVKPGTSITFTAS
jgi:hypothetical protein